MHLEGLVVVISHPGKTFSFWNNCGIGHSGFNQQLPNFWRGLLSIINVPCPIPLTSLMVEKMRQQRNGLRKSYAEFFYPPMEVDQELSSVVSSNINTASSCSEDKDYEVQAVRGYRPNEIGGSYLIKWKNWGEEFNTWEPAKNLHSCEHVLTAFYLETRETYYEERDALDPTSSDGKRRKLKDDKRDRSLLPPDPRSLDEIIEEFSSTVEITEDLVEETLKIHGTMFEKPDLIKEELSQLVEELVFEVISPERKEHLISLIMKTEIYNRKKFLDQSLEHWKKEHNTITEGKPRIEVENCVDLSGLPSESSFIYVNDYRLPTDFRSPACTGCVCKDLCCTSVSSNCCSTDGFPCAYDCNGRVVLPPGSPIFECHESCQCTEGCLNRVVGNGRDGLEGMAYCIFRTTNRGWGVKTVKPIYRGAFVMLLIGEVISKEEALLRQHSSTHDNGKYVFDLDVCGESRYCVDFTTVGNLSRFINHSCSPNLEIYPNWRDHKFGWLPRIAFFASEDIPAQTELTYSYVDIQAFLLFHGVAKDTTNPPEGFSKCMCGSVNCVNFMIFPD